MAMEVEVDDTTSAVPENVSESLKKTLINVQQITSIFDDLLQLSDPQLLAELPPLQRAQSLLTLSRLTTGLFALRLRCAGIRPEDHRVKGEMERISLYQEKLERYVRLSKAPLRPTTKLNFQAATRVIQHSLPDLSDDQRKSFKELSKNESGRISSINRNMLKKRKYESPEKRDKISVRAAAQEFLEKAARELLGDKQDGYKGPIAPILIEDSSDDEEVEEEQEENGVEVELEVEEEEEEEDEEEEEEDVMDHAASVSASASKPIVIDSSDEN